MVERALRLALVGALALQLYLLYLYVPSDETSLSIPHLDKVVHALMFALPATLAVLARFRPWVVALVLLMHAPVSEIVQHLWLPARGGDAWDMLADLTGVVLGLVAGRLVLHAFGCHGPTASPFLTAGDAPRIS